MKQKTILDEHDIKKIIAEKFNVDSNDVYVYVNLSYPGYGSNEDPEVEIVIETEMQNHDL